MICGDLVGGAGVGATGAVRRSLLRAWRDGEPDQGTALVVCRSCQYRDHGSQSNAGVRFRAGVCAGERVAGDRFARHGDGAGAGDDDSVAAVEDWGAGTDHGAESAGATGAELSLASLVLESCRATTLLAGGAEGKKRNRWFDEGGQQEALWPRHAVCCALQPCWACKFASGAQLCRIESRFFKNCKIGSECRSGLVNRGSDSGFVRSPG